MLDEDVEEVDDNDDDDYLGEGEGEAVIVPTVSYVPRGRVSYPAVTILEKTAIIAFRMSEINAGDPIKLPYVASGREVMYIAEEEYDKGLLDGYLVERDLPDGHRETFTVGELKELDKKRRGLHDAR
jgi:hypothetical protein